MIQEIAPTARSVLAICFKKFTQRSQLARTLSFSFSLFIATSELNEEYDSIEESSNELLIDDSSDDSDSEE